MAKMVTMQACFEQPTYRSFHVKFHIDMPEYLDIIDLWWKFNLHIQMAFDELAVGIKENFPLKDILKLEFRQEDLVLKLAKIKTKYLTGKWLMETVEEELGNFRILNVKKPFKVEGLSFREHL